MQKGFRQSLEALYRRSQRESNAHASYGYAQLLMSLIQEWCALFKRPELPFIFAQLPNYTLEPDCDWPRLRDEQRRALTLWNTAMVVTIGYGEDNDLHPLDKRHVAQRLTTAAESLVYGRDCEPMGPLPVMAIHKDDGIEISFIHTGGGLVCTGDVPFDILEPGGLDISGEGLSVRLPWRSRNRACEWRSERALPSTVSVCRPMKHR